MHYRHEVSAKVAIFSDDGQKVLLMRYPKIGQTGLPGGHVEKNEQPDMALRRELLEELDLHLGEIHRTGFFLREHSKGAVILAYTAILPEDTLIQPVVPEKEYSEWVSRSEMEGIVTMSQEYKDFIDNNWPAIKP